MTMLIIQSLLLMAIAYILGCILGCLLHQWFAAAPKAAIAAAAPVAAVAAVAAAPRVTPPAPPPPPAPKPAPVPAPVAVVTSVPKPKAKRAAPAKKRVSKPKPAPVAKPIAKVAAIPDDLKRIKGIGRQNEARLNAVGINTFAQIAAWSKKDQAEMGDRLAFPGRIEREEWVKQAAVLAKGGQTDFSKRVAKGEVSSSMGKGSVGDLGTRPSSIAKARSGKGDNLTLIDGVGNAIEKKLNALGIYHFDQVAAWTAANETWVGNEIGFPGRSQRENWVKEAKILAAGGTTEHAKRVEAGQIGTSRKSKPSEK